MNAADPAVHAALRRAAVYELLSRLFSAPDPEHGRSALHLAFTLSRTDGIPGDVRLRMKELTESLAAVGQEEIEREWQATFGLTDGGPLSLCESEYGMAHIFQKSNALADVAVFYNAFGLERAPGAERPDHLSAEFEFLAFLAAKEAHARSEGKADLAEISRSAERLFLSEHTAQFCIGLFKRVEAGFYAAVSRTGLAACEWLLAEHALTPPDQRSPSLPAGPEEPMACGACPIPGAGTEHG